MQNKLKTNIPFIAVVIDKAAVCVRSVVAHDRSMTVKFSLRALRVECQATVLFADSSTELYERAFLSFMC